MNKILLLSSLLLLGGCARFENRVIDPQSSLTAFETHSLRDPALLAFIQTNCPETEVSNGWNVAGLTLAAFYFQPELNAARAHWEAANAGIDRAGERLNPTLSVIPAFNASSPSDVSPWILGAGLEVPLDYSGKRKARVAEAEALAVSGRLEFVQTAWNIRVQVRSELLAICAARRQTGLLQQQTEWLGELVSLFEGKRSLGEIGRLEVASARQHLASAQLDLMKAQQKEAMATARLASTLGVPAAALKSVLFDFAAFDTLPEQAPVSKVWKQALFNRADILGQLAEYEAAQARLQMEVALQYPDLTIGPGYEFDQGDHKWALGVSLTLPLLNRNQGAIHVASRQRDEAAAQFYALQARVLGRLNEAIIGYAHSIGELRVAREIEQADEKTFQLLEAQVAAGAAGRENLMAGRVDLIAAEQRVLDAHIAAQQALGRLECELQSPADLPGWRDVLESTMDRSEEFHEEK